MKVSKFQWQKTYKAKIEAMSNLALLAEIASHNSCSHNEHWGHDCALVEMEKRLDTITLKAIANSGTDENGDPITILQIEGDSLNIDASGACDLDTSIQIPSIHIQKPCSDKEIEHMVSDAGVAERKHAHAAKYDIKWEHLNCVLNLASCTGPDCNTYLGTDYEKCPHLRK